MPSTSIAASPSPVFVTHPRVLPYTAVAGSATVAELSLWRNLGMNGTYGVPMPSDRVDSSNAWDLGDCKPRKGPASHCPRDACT